jgi:hypothetical protein
MSFLPVSKTFLFFSFEVTENNLYKMEKLDDIVNSLDDEEVARDLSDLPKGINVYTFTQITFADFIIESASGDLFQVSKMVMAHYSKVLRRAVIDDPKCIEIKIDYPNEIIALWLETFHHRFDKERTPIDIDNVAKLIRLYLQYHMQWCLHQCYNVIKKADDMSPELVKLIFTVKPLESLKKYVFRLAISNKLNYIASVAIPPTELHAYRMGVDKQEDQETYNTYWVNNRQSSGNCKMQ